jgi:hypothetical protein
MLLVVGEAAVITSNYSEGKNGDTKGLNSEPPILPRVGTGKHLSSPGSGRTALKHSVAHNDRKRYGRSDRAPVLGRDNTRTNLVPVAI